MNLHNMILAVLLNSLLFLASCGGGESSSTAGGGTGGTGKGTVTASINGSVTVNDIRTFDTNQNTMFSVDGDPVSEAELLALGTGIVVRVDVAEDVSGDFTSGTAQEIAAGHLVKGPVTGVNPLRVLEQTVFFNGDTMEAGGKAIASLVVGDIVEVSGYANPLSTNPPNVIQATRVEFKALGAPVWKLTGPVTSLGGGSTFFIGAQEVDTAGVTPRDCGGGINPGDLVEVKANPISPFPAARILDTVIDLECVQPGLVIPPGAGGGLLVAEVEGLVDSVTIPDPPDFTIDGQRVIATGSTGYEGGDLFDIVLGAKVEAEGVLDPATGILTASRIKFREARMRIEGPMEGFASGQSVQILGLTALASPLTEDVDGTLTTGSPGQQVEVRGFVDSAGTIFATRIRERGPADPAKVRLRGPVTGIPSQPVFTIQGVNVNATGASLFGLNGSPLTEAQFFSAIAAGAQVNVENGTYNGVDTISTSSGYLIEIED